MTRLAIVGAGPKAAAIAARAEVLRDLAIDAPEVVIFETKRPAAAWDGKGGYTDGLALLCTSPDRDVGFPYSHNFGPAAAALMQSRASWQSFLVSTAGYGTWVSRGRRLPTHAEFARYLDWVFKRSGADIRSGAAVTGLSYTSADRWSVTLDSSSVERGFDGIVITGSGPPIAPLAGAPPWQTPDSRVLNGRDFWQHVGRVEANLKALGEDGSVTIIGSGGAAASIADRLVRARLHVPIRIVGKQPVLFARCDTFTEMKIYGDNHAWSRLSDQAKDAFLDRLGAGTVWTRVLEHLADADDLEYVSGEAERIDLITSTNEARLYLKGDPKPIPATLIVDARGFDSWWFKGLLDTSAASVIDIYARRKDLIKFADSMRLLSPFPYPNFHVPGRASRVGPGADNLLALGWMADSILWHYVPPATLALAP